MKTTTRFCAYCQDPFAGRADKLYCSSSCKSKDFRHQQAEAAFEPDEEEAEQEAPRRASSGPYVPVARRESFPQPQGRRAPAPADEELEPDDADDEDEELDEAEFQQLELRRHLNKQALKRLPQQYGACIEKVLAAHEQCVSNKQLRALRTSISETLHAYKCQADHGRLPATFIQHVTDLYRVQELLKEAWQAHSENYKPVDFYVKKKLRVHLRTSLILLLRP